MYPVERPMDTLSQLLRFASTLVHGWWGAFLAISNFLSVAVFFASPFMPQPNLTRWLAFLMFLVVFGAFVRASFNIWRKQEESIELLKRDNEELRRPQFSEEIRQSAAKYWSELCREERIAITLLFYEGDLTERQALQRLQSNGMATGRGSIYQGIAERTNFVKLVAADARGAYLGQWTVTPHYRTVLADLVRRDSQAQQPS